jgi:hypothetical protein
MQLDGVQIDPKEWWDSHWIQDHVAKRVELPGFKEEVGGMSGAVSGSSINSKRRAHARPSKSRDRR